MSEKPFTLPADLSAEGARNLVGAQLARLQRGLSAAETLVGTLRQGIEDRDRIITRLKADLTDAREQRNDLKREMSSFERRNGDPAALTAITEELARWRAVAVLALEGIGAVEGRLTGMLATPAPGCLNHDEKDSRIHLMTDTMERFEEAESVKEAVDAAVTEMIQTESLPKPSHNHTSADGKKVCSVPWCEKAVIARGWCSKHYERWRQHGDPLCTTVDPSDHAKKACQHNGVLAREVAEGQCEIVTEGSER